jgi:two-component system chemotaxis response regulator CheB
MKSVEEYQYIVAIGTSTGGPKALSKLMSMLPKNLPAAYVIVQHMPAGFTKSLAQRLDGLSEVVVKEACDGDILRSGKAYLAPGGYQLRIINASKPQISITDEEVYKNHKPSVNIMMRSLANLKSNKKVIPVIMTGMGTDGLEGIQEICKSQSVQVIAESEETCVVYGMPKAIVQANLARHVVPLTEIASTIIKVMGE